MMVYHPNGSAAAIDFREVAPATATADMFHSNSSLSTNVSVITSLQCHMTSLYQIPLFKTCRNEYTLTPAVLDTMLVKSGHFLLYQGGLG